MNLLDKINSKDKLKLNKLEKIISFSQNDEQELIIVSCDSQSLSESFVLYFNDFLDDSVEIKDIKVGLFKDIIFNHEKYSNRHILINLYDVKNYKEIMEEFQFKRDYIPHHKLKIILILNVNQAENFRTKAYDFFSFNNFFHFFEDHSFEYTSQSMSAPLDILIEKYEKIKHTQFSNLNRIKQLFDIAKKAQEYSHLNLALSYYEQALKISVKIKNKSNISAISGNIGILYQSLGDLQEALKYQKAALKINKEIGYLQGEAIDLANIGNIYQSLGNLDEAMKYQQEAFKIAKILGIKDTIQTIEENIKDIKNIKQRGKI
jgi:tetratricopeptide (TPR) repeat protein